MLRIFCSTNRCVYLSQLGERDRAALAEARRERDDLVEQVGVMAAGERNAQAAASRNEGYRADALRRRVTGKATQASLLEGEGDNGAD